MAKEETVARTIARNITYNQANRLETFLDQEPPLQAAIFEVLSPYVQQQLLKELSIDQTIPLLDALDLHKATTALAQLKDTKRKEKIILRLKSELKEKAEVFLRFHTKATLDLINFNYLLLASDTTVDDTATAMDAFYSETKKFPEILVHHNGFLIGEVPYATLIRATKKAKLDKLVSPIETIVYSAETTDAIDLLDQAKTSKVVIKDIDESVIGIIYTADAQELFKKQPASSLYEFAGVAESERPFDSVTKKVERRYKWLIINLGTAFLAGAVVSFYEDTLSELVLLAMYLPIIAGMGGNAATQTLAVMVRGISVGEITFSNCLPALKREIIAGVVNGVINGVIIGIVAIFWNQNPLLGLVLAIAMVCNLAIAAIAGTLTPLVMKKLNKDPATSATIFMTTFTDVLGFVVFLGLATLFLI
jgi:magnesium transporter